MANEKTESITHQWYQIDGGGDSSASCIVGNIDFGPGGDPVKGALRFDGVEMSQGGSLNFAKLMYRYGSVGGTGTWRFKLYGIDEDDTAAFGYPFGRTKTTASNTYSEGEPTSGGTKEMDVRSILNEIAGRGGWSSGNAVGFLLEDNGSDNDVYAFANLSTSFLAYRQSAEPDFTPTPVSVSAPSLPTPEDYGIKFAYPGVDVFNATEEELYYTSKKFQFKVVEEGQIVTSGSPHNIAHGLSKIPFAAVFAKSGSSWFKLPFMNFSGGSNVGYMSVDSTHLKIYAGTGTTVYYYIFLDELAS